MKGLGRNFTLVFAGAIGGLVLLAIVLTSFERPGATVTQTGFRGTSMGQVENPRLVAAALPLHAVPEPLEPAEPATSDEDKARAVYENVQVLGDLSVAQFNRIMVAMTAWVSPEETVENGGCAYCHNVENMASDEVYTKHVARRMLQMTHRINTAWESHVGEVGVTCYTCHRGQPVPANVWSTAPVQGRAEGLLATATGQNRAAPAAGLASLPYDPFAPFLAGEEQQIRVNGVRPLPHGNNSSIKQAEWTYSLMMHMSSALGVNCTFCHNSRAFFDWEQSPPTRTSAWYGIRMLRDVNANYIEPLREHFPPHRLGPLGDPLKVNCTTCHQGVNQPLYGAQMLRDYPELNLVADGPARSAAATR